VEIARAAIRERHTSGSDTENMLVVPLPPVDELRPWCRLWTLFARDEWFSWLEGICADLAERDQVGFPTQHLRLLLDQAGIAPPLASAA
jgi:hypothetical protein